MGATGAGEKHRDREEERTGGKGNVPTISKCSFSPHSSFVQTKYDKWWTLTHTLAEGAIVQSFKSSSRGIRQIQLQPIKANIAASATTTQSIIQG